MNIVANGPVGAVRAITDRYRSKWAKGPHAGETMALLGVSRHVVIADSDTDAIGLAREPYRRWRESLLHRWRQHGVPSPLMLPEDIVEACDAGFCLVGSVATVRDRLIRQADAAGINYGLCRLAFGDLPMAASLQTVALLEREVMPVFMNT